ncbi:hypothetical protein [[Mycobacterium] crassicus]|uniref:Metallothionein n=1 Tax=[Mycobacterium] crassicus TaxID=2872309 RepID=A0ABU5XIZ6_9MYCO|nr:hypothetical protein [Mycolicibacter sp. MYC098]MEB3021287.1 hypothetical protein [Mycolicibacter sp. MYC098]
MAQHPILCLCGHFHGGTCHCGCTTYDPDTCHICDSHGCADCNT